MFFITNSLATRKSDFGHISTLKENKTKNYLERVIFVIIIIKPLDA